MKNRICKKTGIVTFIPECELDKQLLFHLMDCADLTEFSMYISNYPNMANNPMTTDLEVTPDELKSYPCPSQMFYYKSDLPYEPVKPVSLYTGDMIGFDRKFVEGKLTDEMIIDYYTKQK